MDRLWHLVRLHVPLWGWESVAILVALMVIASAAAFASAAALFVNYGGVRRLVFRSEGE